MEIKTIYKDKDFIAVLKPAGIVTHPDNQHELKKSLIGEILKKYPEIKNVGEDVSRPGVVHRLDKDTSGVLLVARTQSGFEYLKNLFQQQKIKKSYLALVKGALKTKKGIIEGALGRTKTGIFGTYKLKGKERPAITEYKVLEIFKNKLGEFSLLEVFPKTGRTHQIRVHLKSIGHPVICDKIYGGKNTICPFSLTHQFLHAYSLEFVSPSGAALRLETILPEDLNSVLEKLRNKTIHKFHDREIYG